MDNLKILDGRLSDSTVKIEHIGLSVCATHKHRHAMDNSIERLKDRDVRKNMRLSSCRISETIRKKAKVT